MTVEEAKEWITGYRSMCNSIGSSDPDRCQVLVAQADAAMMEQAYWVLRTSKEGLIKSSQDDLTRAIDRLGGE